MVAAARTPSSERGQQTPLGPCPGQRVDVPRPARLIKIMRTKTHNPLEMAQFSEASGGSRQSAESRAARRQHSALSPVSPRPLQTEKHSPTQLRQLG